MNERNKINQEFMNITNALYMDYHSNLLPPLIDMSLEDRIAIFQSEVIPKLLSLRDFYIKINKFIPTSDLNKILENIKDLKEKSHRSKGNSIDDILNIANSFKETEYNIELSVAQEDINLSDLLPLIDILPKDISASTYFLDDEFLSNLNESELNEYANYLILLHQSKYITDSILKKSHILQISNNIKIWINNIQKHSHAFTDIIEKNNLIKNNLKNEVDKVKEIIQQFKENITILVNHDLLDGYSEEAKNLNKNIERLDKLIIYIFILIIVILAIKFLFILFLGNIFNDWLNFLSFMVLVFSLTAILTYFIKDRNRLIKLHDHYNLSKLELKALPSYMNELEPQQRKELYIKLAHNYFKGANEDKTIVSEGNNIENITSTLRETIKILQDMKNVK